MVSTYPLEDQDGNDLGTHPFETPPMAGDELLINGKSYDVVKRVFVDGLLTLIVYVDKS